MILSGQQIKKAFESGAWTVTRDGQRVGVEALNIGPNSCDLQLGNGVQFYAREVKSFIQQSHFARVHVEPGDFILGHTREAIDCSAPLTIRGQQWYFVPMLEGRSTLARMGVSIHHCAGFGDFSFSAQWTLEITTALPATLTPGMRIGQVYFVAMLTEEGEIPTRYSGAYANQRGAQQAIVGEGRF